MKMTFYKNMIYSEIKYPSEVRIEYISSTTKPNSLSSISENTNISGQNSPSLNFYGPLGSISIDLQKIDPYGLSFFSIRNAEITKNLEIYVKKNGTGESSKTATGLSGSLFSLCKNSIKGVSQGFVIFLELIGVGYKATIIETTINNIKNEKLKLGQDSNGQNIEFKLGQSHDIIYKLPNSVKAFSVKPTLLGLYGINKTQLGQIASKIRELRPPEPYKGKGIRYKDEIFKVKIGKKK
jgi:large subunit ribosomal protein L6